MTADLILAISQIALCVILSSLILLQARGTGLSANFGGFYRSKRGLERLLFVSTIVSSILFVINSIVLLILK